MLVKKPTANMTVIDDVFAHLVTERFPLPTEKDVENLEARIKCRSPENYRQFLLDYNGGFFNDPEIEQVGE
jgi:hypothetical protein